jgi:hypothetical protein
VRKGVVGLLENWEACICALLGFGRRDGEERGLSDYGCGLRPCSVPFLLLTPSPPESFLWAVCDFALCSSHSRVTSSTVCY